MKRNGKRGTGQDGGRKTKTDGREEKRDGMKAINDQVMRGDHGRRRVGLSGMQWMMTESRGMCWTNKTLLEEMQQVMKSGARGGGLMER